MSLRRKGLLAQFGQVISDAVFGTEEDRMRAYFTAHAQKNTPAPNYEIAVEDIEAIAGGILEGSYKIQPTPQGSFSSLRDLEDRKLASRAGQDVGGKILIPINTTQVGIVFDRAVDANGIMILSRVFDRNGNSLESSDSARISIETNHDGIFLPFSYNALPQGVQKSDMVVYTGKVTWLTIRCEVVSQESAQPSVLLLITKDVGLSGPWGGLQLYQRPQAAAGNPGSGSSPTSNQPAGGVSSGGGVSDTGSGGGTSSSGGGTFVGPTGGLGGGQVGTGIKR